MTDNKKQIIDAILNDMVDIITFDYKNAINKQLVGYRYKNSYSINSVIKKCKGLCTKDWDEEILRDQTYASVYGTMLKIAKNHTEDELKLIHSDLKTRKLEITNQFLTGVYKLSILDVKCKLSGYRRDGRNGMINTFDLIEYNEQNLNHMLETSDLDLETEIDIIFFISWFNQNKENFLTPKQLLFLEDENMSKTNKSAYRKRIYEATMKAYNNTFNNCENERINELKCAINNIEKLLDNPEFDKVIIKTMNQKNYIMDAIVSYVDLPTMQRFNKGDHSYEVVKKYRVALFKKLAELNKLLDETTNSMK